MSLQIGDFIAIATLATTVIQALNSARGSKFEFTSLLSALNAMKYAMLQAEKFCIECHASPSCNNSTDPFRLERLDSIGHEITTERKECEALLEQFLKNFEAYNDAFMEPGIGMVRQSLKKLTWMGCRDEAATLEKRLNAHMQAFQLHLHTYCQ